MIPAAKVTEFEAALARDGFVEITTKSIEPGHSNGEHGHHFTARGLILEGAFHITSGGARRRYGPGEIFDVVEGTLHFEETESEGARLVVGRKY